MFGAIIGAAVSLASTAIGAAANKRNADRQQSNLNAEKAANEAYRNRYYFEDPMARAGARRMMQQQLENVRQLNRAEEGKRAVVGGTEESVVASRQAGSKALSDTAGNIVEKSDARKDAVDAQYMKTRAILAGQQQDIDTARANNVSTAVQAAGHIGSQIATSVDGVRNSRSTTNDDTRGNVLESPEVKNASAKVAANHGIKMGSAKPLGPGAVQFKPNELPFSGKRGTAMYGDYEQSIEDERYGTRYSG